MANPAIKNGYTPIANVLVEVFSRTNITGEEWRVIWAVVRATWGWKEGRRRRDWVKLSYNEIAKYTGIKRPNCVRTVNTLVSKRILDKTKDGLKLNQNYDRWLVSRKILGGGGSIKEDTRVVSSSLWKLKNHSLHLKKELKKELIRARAGETEILEPIREQDQQYVNTRESEKHEEIKPSEIVIKSNQTPMNLEDKPPVQVNIVNVTSHETRHEFTQNVNNSAGFSGNPSRPFYQPDLADSWAKFWTAYPKKVAAVEARNLWLHLNPDKPLQQVIMLSLDAQKKSAQWRDIRYIPSPVNWLKGARWEDEVSDSKAVEISKF